MNKIPSLEKLILAGVLDHIIGMFLGLDEGPERAEACHAAARRGNEILAHYGYEPGLAVYENYGRVTVRKSRKVQS